MASAVLDAVVVGAGLGGLAAAARMAREGLRVTVFEQNPHPGGTAYAFRRGGFTFPMGPLGFGGRETVGRILSDLDGSPPPRFRRIGYRLKALGADLPLSLPFEALAVELGRHFPAEREGIRRFFADAAALGGSRASGAPSALISRPAADHLRSLVADASLRRILGSIGTEEPYSSMPLLAAMWRLMAEEGIWYPEGGPSGVADRLASAVSGPARGVPGTIRLRTRVARILLRKGRASGVALADGSRIEARAVVSNADGKTTFLDLLDPKDLPGDWRRAVAEARLTGSVIQVALGLARTFDESAFAGGTRLICRRPGAMEASPDWRAPEIKPDSLAAQELEIGLLSEDDARLAPSGSRALVIRTAADYAHFEPFRLGHRKRAPGYAGYKARLAGALVREAGRLLPGLPEAVTVTDVSTPLTFRDQGGRARGAVAGWSWDFGDLPPGMPPELTETPVPGLFVAGHQARTAFFSGGVPQALESGLAAAGLVLAAT